MLRRDCAERARWKHARFGHRPRLVYRTGNGPGLPSPNSVGRAREGHGKTTGNGPRKGAGTGRKAGQALASACLCHTCGHRCGHRSRHTRGHRRSDRRTDRQAQGARKAASIARPREPARRARARTAASPLPRTSEAGTTAPCPRASTVRTENAGREARAERYAGRTGNGTRSAWGTGREARGEEGSARAFRDAAASGSCPRCSVSLVRGRGTRRHLRPANAAVRCRPRCRPGSHRSRRSRAWRRSALRR